MDTSNPILSSDRVTGEELFRRSRIRMRQDLAWLGEKLRSSTRIHLPVKTAQSEEAAAAERSSWIASLPKLDKSKKEGYADIGLRQFGTIAVTGAENSLGVRIHPNQVAQKEGAKEEGEKAGPPVVCVNRQFGTASRGHIMGATRFAEAMGEGSLARAHYVYTTGTDKGFRTRLRKQLTRKTVPLGKAWGKSGKVSADDELVDILMKLMPVDWSKSTIPGTWHDGLVDQVHLIKTTASASAGAPYWRSTADAWEDITEVGLAKFYDIVQRVQSQEDLVKVIEEDPEWFLLECKNKEDRHPLEELVQVDEDKLKTRPYFNLGKHAQLMLSIPCQRFCEVLKTFDEDPKSCNAYGFSGAHGGLMKKVQWAEATKKARMKAYGDDSELVVRRPDGTLWIADPDFRQMDGSVDAQTVRVTCKWVYRVLAEKYGDNDFWKCICTVWWPFFALKAPFIIDGVETYIKPAGTWGGLYTGVVGTTLFDTVKSVMAWAAYMKESPLKVERNYDRFMDSRRIKEWMMNECGLEIKGEVKFEQITPFADLQAGDIWSKQKFLGVHIKKMLFYPKGRRAAEPVAVPYLDDDDWTQIIMSPREREYMAGGRGGLTARQRTHFDRLRGWLITGAFSNERILNAINHMINEVSPVAICMEVQNGTGELPENVATVGETFKYPDSQGIPTMAWFLGLYHSEPEPDTWIPLFPEAEEFIQEHFRGKNRVLEPVLKGPKNDKKVRFVPVAEPEYNEIQPQHAPQPVLTAPPPRDQYGGRQPVKGPRTMAENIRAAVEANGGIMFYESLLGAVGARGKPYPDVIREITKARLFVSGGERPTIVSSKPLITVDENKEGEKQFRKALKAVQVVSTKKDYTTSAQSLISRTPRVVPGGDSYSVDATEDVIIEETAPVEVAPICKSLAVEWENYSEKEWADAFNIEAVRQRVVGVLGKLGYEAGYSYSPAGWDDEGRAQTECDLWYQVRQKSTTRSTLARGVGHSKTEAAKKVAGAVDAVLMRGRPKLPEKRKPVLSRVGVPNPPKKDWYEEGECEKLEAFLAPKIEQRFERKPMTMEPPIEGDKKWLKSMGFQTIPQYLLSFVPPRYRQDFYRELLEKDRYWRLKGAHGQEVRERILDWGWTVLHSEGFVDAETPIVREPYKGSKKELYGGRWATRSRNDNNNLSRQ